jgi:TonB family protein
MEVSMSLFASLLFNAVVAAGPATPLPWFHFLDDYPMKAFDRNWQGTTVMALTVSPEGRPVACAIDQSSGYELLDRQTCMIGMKRPRFTPAYGPDGRAVYGVYRSQIVWSRPDRDYMQRDPGPDLEVQVAALPDGARQPPAVKLSYYVDAAGNLSQCTPYPENRQPQALVDAACTELLAKLPHAPVTVHGAAVPAVKTAAVLFTTAK